MPRLPSLGVATLLCLLCSLCAESRFRNHLWQVDHSNMQRHSHSITVVTGYFTLKSKHSIEEYVQWMENFLPKINNAMVLFADPATERHVRHLRTGKPSVFCVFEDVWALPMFASYAKAYRTVQHEMDPEKDIHSPELYMVWNSKMFMMKTTARNNPFQSKYFFWVDSGAFRASHTLKQWPDLPQIESIFRGFEDRVLVGMVQNPSDEFLNRPSGICNNDSLIQAGFFGAQRGPLLWYTDKFFETHEAMFSKGCFVGKEQNIMTQIVSAHRERFLLLDAAKQYCGDMWFYFLQGVAGASERDIGCPEPLIVVSTGTPHNNS